MDVNSQVIEVERRNGAGSAKRQDTDFAPI